MHQQGRDLEWNPRAPPAPIPQQPRIQAKRQQDHEVAAQRGMAEAHDEGRHRGRHQGHGQRRHHAAHPKAPEREDGADGLHQPGERIEQPDAVESWPRRQQLQRQCQGRNAVKKGEIDALERADCQGRPAPNIGQEVPLRDGMLRGIARLPPSLTRLRPDEIQRKQGNDEASSHQA
jgi:hypothetical protein